MMTAPAEGGVRFAAAWAPLGARMAGTMARVATVLRGLGPYAAIELILPGGSVLALLLWLYRRHRNNTPGRLRLGWLRKTFGAASVCA